MPFLFSYVCDLLQRLEDNRFARAGLKTDTNIIQEWFRAQRGLLYRDDHNSAAFISALLPDKRTDRVYFIREKKLQIIIGRALGLGRSRIAELGRWSNPEARADLADCVESILKQTPNPVSPAHRPVTVEEIDQVLHSLAAACRFSSPAVRSSAPDYCPADQELSLGDLYRRLSARDAKWLTRLILKNYEPVILEPHVVCLSYHPLLPCILKVQDNLAVAGRILDTLRRDRTVTGGSELAEYLKPILGVKVGRQTWLKGRSIKHCLSMLQGRVSCEEKMDGEYCQIHIDLSKGYDCIQIFSKSGKDSTKDRMALHNSIRQSLQLGQPSCPLKSGCILEGELVVYSDKHSRILDFHKIRKHVTRSGSFLGTDKDSQPHPWEHLMVVYYDLLMVDNESLLAVKHSERFRRLRNLITQVPGRSALVKREIIDCTRHSAVADLRRTFAKCITARGEGLVLKADEPYFDFATQCRPYSCCAIKLKKEYIGCFGDIGDFAVVGARFDAAKARTYDIPRVKWTHFYVGCLENKDEVKRFGKQPRFVVTSVVELNATQLDTFMSSVNPESVRPEDNTAISLRIEPGVDNGKRPSAIFPAPPVFDIRCFSFDKEGNTGFWSPRFPAVAKIHCDRTYHDVISFAELQEMAAREKEAPVPEDSQELLGWIATLETLEPHATVDTTSQSTVSMTTMSTQSPQLLRRSAQPDHPALTSPTRRLRTIQPIRAPPAGGQLTPPTSSETHMPGSTSPDTMDKQDRAPSTRKRSFDSSAQSTILERIKFRRCSTDHADFTARLPDRNRTQVTEKQQQSLPVTVAGTSRRNTQKTPSRPGPSSSVSMHQQDSGDKQLDVQKCTSFHGRPSQSFSAAISVARTNSSPSTHQSVDEPTELNTAAAKCPLFPDTCRIAAYSILLSPCVADFPWVTDDLLSCHGVAEFLRDPKEWFNGHRDDTANQNSTCYGRKKLVLVDARRKEATVAFLQSIEAARLRRDHGEREYVPVYHWKVLEAIREEELKFSSNNWELGSQFSLNGSSSLWRRFWVGLA
ncbi:hypothetical protein N657DRAFT_575760 [Parathielavia appendiculata]|uniref:ATP-dependent DNA ligase family profile domain-containing protein n=1 Tax=Parathielavia appendiculata TaxID=2587402 RepID=A0AAN6TWV4_9PEZI|nr:hypothetical protein N657DRAFT_575760 [Parathielavia appendiculata]